MMPRSVSWFVERWPIVAAALAASASFLYLMRRPQGRSIVEHGSTAYKIYSGILASICIGYATFTGRLPVRLTDWNQFALALAAVGVLLFTLSFGLRGTPFGERCNTWLMRALKVPQMIAPAYPFNAAVHGLDQVLIALEVDSESGRRDARKRFAEQDAAIRVVLKRVKLPTDAMDEVLKVAEQCRERMDDLLQNPANHDARIEAVGRYRGALLGAGVVMPSAQKRKPRMT